MARILLVEDDRAIVESLGAYLRGEGLDTASAAGERAARELLARERFDLLLVDMALEEGSGRGVCAAARERTCP